MKVLALFTLVLCACLCAAMESGAQPRVGALAIDEGQGDQYGWAVDYETTAAAGEAALRECGAGCSVVLTFGRCGAYATDQDTDSTAVGWAEAYSSAEVARQTALAQCRSRGGSGCVVRVWGCNGQVIEEALALDRAARRQIQEGLRSAGFDPGGADGLFGPRTRAAIRTWQLSRGGRATGYVDGAAAEALRSAGAEPTATAAGAGVSVAPPVAPGAQQPATTGQLSSPAATAELEGLFWQSIMNSTNPADFEAYLSQFPNGVFRVLAQNRLATFRSPGSDSRASTGARVAGTALPGSGAGIPATAVAAGGDAPRRRPGEVFRDCDACPEMVVVADGRLALGRYEVTVGEYRRFASSTGSSADACTAFLDGDSWRNPGFRQSERHPVTCVNWNDAQEYVAWLSQMTEATYRLPTEAEWTRAANGSPPGGCGPRNVDEGTCPVGSDRPNRAGLFDMVGNVSEWTEDCWDPGCDRRVLRGSAWFWNSEPDHNRRRGERDGFRFSGWGLRVARTLIESRFPNTP